MTQETAIALEVDLIHHLIRVTTNSGRIYMFTYDPMRMMIAEDANIETERGA